MAGKSRCASRCPTHDLAAPVGAAAGAGVRVLGVSVPCDGSGTRAPDFSRELAHWPAGWPCTCCGVELSQCAKERRFTCCGECEHKQQRKEAP